MSVLVITGGTGTLGKAIIEHQDLLASHGIKKIRVLSRDEQKQVALTRSYRGSIQLGCYLADVSDRERMVFGLRDADYVIHAAAQKHIDKFELDVKTGYKNNILGTQHVSDAFAMSKNAKRGLFVSTDKACLPITAYGVSKLASEHLWLWHNTYQSEISFSVARYGNVFASRGSVIETWTNQAKAKQPLTVTDPSCTRFFITPTQAAHFVVNALFDPKGEKKIYIPPMKATNMVKLAALIWEYHNPSDIDCPVEWVGFRGVEKTHEILEENGVSSAHAERFTLEELREMYEASL